jgi:putative hydrolase of the HAD superfamily
MTQRTIRAVVFDLGGTLEEIYYDAALRVEATRGLQQLLIECDLNPGLPLSKLQATILAGIRAYSDWREKTEIELPPEQVWTEYIFPDAGLPKERLMAAAEDLTFFYETQFHARTLRPESPDALEALRARGYRLAVISNIISRRMVQVKLEEYGIARFFDPILTSSNFGRRKPNERIFLECARLLALPPADCAYVGDTISRDVSGARRSGYGLAIQIKSFLTGRADKDTDVEQPDALIQDLRELVGLMER